VYGYCYYNGTVDRPELRHSEADLLLHNQRLRVLPELIPCTYVDGLYHYFNINTEAFHGPPTGWQGPCNANVTRAYNQSQSGSTQELTYLIFRGKYRIVLYNGDWDVVIPFRDTLENIKNLFVQPVGDWTPWSVGGQHAGFYQNYTMNLRFVTIKGASHMAPQTKRAAAFELFSSTIWQK
jgi:hypothetical protein